MAFLCARSGRFLMNCDVWIIEISVQKSRFTELVTIPKISKYGVFSGPYFLVFSPNTGKYGPEKTPYLDTFLAVGGILICLHVM